MRKLGVYSLFFVLISSLLIVNSSAAVATDETVLPVITIGGEQGGSNGKFNEPDSVFVAASGEIYAGDTENFRVQVFDAEGNYLRKLTGFDTEAVGNEVQGIGQLANGTIVVVEKAGGLYFFDPVDGDQTGFVDLEVLAGLGSVDTQGLAVHPETDDIYVTNQPEHLMLVIGSDGSLVANWTTGVFTTPENLAFDAERDRIYVSTEGQGSITAYSYNGTKIGEFGSDDASTNFEGVVVDPLGHIIAVDEGFDSGSSAVSRIVIFDPSNYSALYAWGGAVGSDPGRFTSPDGIAFDAMHNRIFIADQGNFRLQGFDYIDILESNGLFSDSTAPTVTDVADSSVSIQEGPSDFTLTWTLGDNADFALSYNVTVDGTLDSSGVVFDGAEVSYSQDVAVAGTISITIDVADSFGNTASDSVTITVPEVTTEETSDTSTEESSTPEETSSSESPLGIAGLGALALVPILRKRED
ncbi:MAG: NHL repeat-containing protein [Candidatus Kariarchaeaceae archaeon]